MPVEFNCEHCDMLLSADVAPGGEVTCPHCQSVTVVPEGLASLPSPQVPGEEAPQGPAPQAPGEPEGDEEEFADEEEPEERDKSFMHVMALGMPWLISLFFHVAIMLILSLVVMYTIMEKAKSDAKSESVVPPEKPEILTDTMETTQVDPSNRPATQRDFSPQERPSLDTRPSSDVVSPIAMMTEGAPPGSGFGGPGGDGGGGGGGGFMGAPPAGARNVVYVIDRSGSMHKTFGLVRKEMLNSISKLSEGQDFHVILFATGKPFEKEPSRLTAATDEFKGNAAAFLEGVEAEGATDPIPALERAFSLLRGARRDRPGKLIHLLTDGNFPDNQATLEAIKDLNRKQGDDVHINTFLYGRRPVEAERIMKLIAEENQGLYKYVSPDEAY